MYSWPTVYHETTGYTPTMLMLGRKVLISLGIMYGFLGKQEPECSRICIGIANSERDQ